MQRNDVRASSQNVLLAAWPILRAPVMALAALFLFSIGCDRVFGIDEITSKNNYTCDCSCSRRVTGDGAFVFSSPGGIFVGVVPLGTTGSILEGPGEANNSTWWKVHFDTGLEGWVQETLLTVANETLVTKMAQACLPQHLNPNRGGDKPERDDLVDFCTGDAEDTAQGVVNVMLAPFGRFLCECDANAVELGYHLACDTPCTDGSDVCLVPGTDPPDPIPDPVSAALFQPVSECEVAGEATIIANGHAPKDQPTLEGVLQIRGRPCPAGEGCRVGMSYQLTSDDIEFESGTIFADDPKFVDLALSGATEPEAINLGPFLGGYLGEVLAGTAFSSAHGRRSGSTDAFAVNGRNNEGLALAMNWADKKCRIAGELVGQAEDNEGEFDGQVEVALDGDIVNQPPRPDAGPDQTVECTSPDGADVTLDASGSTDADNNISFYEWRSESQSGPQVTAPSSDPVTQTQQTLGDQVYYLRVVDRRFAADDDSVGVSVADTTAPQILCNAPATIVPSDVPKQTKKPRQGISFTATAEDSCTGVSAVMIDSFACTRPTSCEVGIQGATLTIYDSGGIDDIISWIVSAQDAAGNSSQQACQLSVVKKK